jgi:hypothetical protein
MRRRLVSRLFYRKKLSQGVHAKGAQDEIGFRGHDRKGGPAILLVLASSISGHSLQQHADPLLGLRLIIDMASFSLLPFPLPPSQFSTGLSSFPISFYALLPLAWYVNYGPWGSRAPALKHGDGHWYFYRACWIIGAGFILYNLYGASSSCLPPSLSFLPPLLAAVDLSIYALES